jgi:hypothetical protein
MFGYPSRWAAISTCSGLLITPKPTMLFMFYSGGDVVSMDCKPCPFDDFQQEVNVHFVGISLSCPLSGEDRAYCTKYSVSFVWGVIV